MMKKLLACAIFSILIVAKAWAQPTIAIKNAAQHIGQTVTICDNVVDGKLIPASNNTMLNIGGNGPQQKLRVLIPAAYRNNFKGHPEIDYSGKDVQVTGKIIIDNGKPELILTDPKHLKLVLMDNARGAAFDVKP